MRLNQFKRKDIPFYPVLFLESFFPERARRLVILLSQYLLLFFLLGVTLVELYGNNIPILTRLLGGSIVLFVFSAVTLMLEAFFMSYYDTGRTNLELSAGEMIYRATKGDLARALFSLPLGDVLRARAGISPEILWGFLSARRDLIFDYELPRLESDRFFTTKELVLALFEQDESFSRMFFDLGIGRRELSNILDWIELDEASRVNKERWWTRENLSSRRAIGKDFAFGRTFFLDKFSHDLSTDRQLFSEASPRSYRPDVVSKMEVAFSKAKNANVILVGEPGAGVAEAVFDLARKIVSGRVVAPVAYSRVVDLDWNRLISESKQKGEFENNFFRCLDEALSAGNVILVMQNFPAFVASAEALGSGVTNLIGPYLEKNVQIIATAEPAAYHQRVETNASLSQYFERVFIEEPEEKKIFEIVENHLREIESTKGVFFTYQALSEVIRAANNYITVGVQPAKSINLILGLVASMPPRGRKVVGKREVDDFVRAKTNIPVGELVAGEKDTLLNLEQELHKRVVGQEEAVRVISNAMRRARAGVRDPKRPAGSFLFLGPTGVGKTETAKALAQIFYGDEKYLLRLDMSEYQSSDAIDKLIGSFGGDRVGILSSMLREKPFGVLLLDEFEKADRDVLNLFLQILDEGFFSDMSGRRVSTQNIIFIATSNAASEMIFDITEKGGDPVDKKTEIINGIVSGGIYRPELINRFDDVVIFHPLNKDELRQIAILMLKKLAKRLGEKGIELVINQVIVDKVVSAGYNRTFGARPMNRAIQELVEEVAARKIISGELKPGSKLEFTS